MRKHFAALVMAAALPLTALAQQGTAPGAPQGRGPAQGQPQGQGQRAGPGQRGDPERMEKRMRLARTLGLAEALDLDAAQALKLGESIAKFDEKRLAAHKQLRDARDVLRRAAQGEQVAAADVDQAIQRSLDARAQVQAVDREIVATVTKDLPPEKKARAVLFLSKFQSRFGGRGMGPGMGSRRGDEMGPGRMRGGRGGMGMGPGGPGMMGMGGPGGPGAGDGDWEDEDE